MDSTIVEKTSNHPQKSRRTTTRMISINFSAHYTSHKLDPRNTPRIKPQLFIAHTTITPRLNTHPKSSRAAFRSAERCVFHAARARNFGEKWGV